MVGTRILYYILHSRLPAWASGRQYQYMWNISTQVSHRKSLSNQVPKSLIKLVRMSQWNEI